MSPPTAPGIFQETRFHNKQYLSECVCVCVCVYDLKFLLIPQFQEQICCNPLTEISAERGVRVQQ